MKTPDDSFEADIPQVAVCYYRCASADQADQKRALEAQHAACYALATSRGLDVLAAFADIGASSLDRSRLGLKDLLDFVRLNAPVTVIVTDIARLARDNTDPAIIVDEIETTGSKVLTVTGDDTTTRCANALISLIVNHIEHRERP
jgi:DNA invertase Pin-like site-specific DNA recombinase